ncbi:MAG: DUF421 domain-containing protein [Sporomusaceae bacterium]|nr:DUF421 domain-containing protein [Sporomusaceae bacterium]
MGKILAGYLHLLFKEAPTIESVLETSYRTLIGFVVLLALTRILGKKQLGQLTYFTYITGIAMGNIAGDMVVHRDVGIADGVAGLIVWAVLTFLVEYVSLKSPTVRVALDGEPTIVIKRGRIMQQALAAHRLNMDDLSMMLRTNNVFSIQEIDYAILEPNGQLSILKKAQYDQASRQDLNISPQPRRYIPTEIVSDGRLLDRNLTELGLDRSWLDQQLAQAGYTSIDKIFLAELQCDGSLYIEGKMVH